MGVGLDWQKEQGIKINKQQEDLVGGSGFHREVRIVEANSPWHLS